MSKGFATSVCVVMVIATGACLPVVRACDLSFDGVLTGETVVGASDGAASPVAILSGSNQPSFKPVYSRRVAGPNLSLTPAISTGHFPSRWRQAGNRCCVLHPADSCLFLLHCRLII